MKKKNMNKKFFLLSSYPSNATTWSAEGIITSYLGYGSDGVYKLNVTAYALCSQ